MKIPLPLLLLITILANSVQADTGSPFFGDPPDDHHPWAKHDRNRPLPPVVQPGNTPGAPPSDAIVLFDGTEASFLNNWTHERPADKRKADWKVIDGAMQPVKGAGYIQTLEEWGDCQLHVEWRAPTEIAGPGQKRGNSGVFLMGALEVQILDIYDNTTYADGMAGAVYGLMPPAANPLRPPGEWQSYDIIFRRPIVRDGEVIDEGSVTVLCNGVVVQAASPLAGGSGFKKRHPYNREFPDAGPLKLQDHGNPVRFRNIWYRPLPPRPVDGGTDGRLSKSATHTKRAEIAGEIQAKATSEQGLEKALLLLESLVYQEDLNTQYESDRLVLEYLNQFESMPSAEQDNEKQNMLSLHRALDYLTKHDYLDSQNAAVLRTQSIVESRGWVKKK